MIKFEILFANHGCYILQTKEEDSAALLLGEGGGAFVPIEWPACTCGKGALMPKCNKEDPKLYAYCISSCLQFQFDHPCLQVWVKIMSSSSQPPSIWPLQHHQRNSAVFLKIWRVETKRRNETGQSVPVFLTTASDLELLATMDDEWDLKITAELEEPAELTLFEDSL